MNATHGLNTLNQPIANHYRFVCFPVSIYLTSIIIVIMIQLNTKMCSGCLPRGRWKTMSEMRISLAVNTGDILMCAMMMIVCASVRKLWWIIWAIVTFYFYVRMGYRSRFVGREINFRCRPLWPIRLYSRCSRDYSVHNCILSVRTNRQLCSCSWLYIISGCVWLVFTKKINKAYN